MRQDLKLCRLCAKSSKNMPTISLFERSRKLVLRRIFQLTSIKLKKVSNIPAVMCSDCETELNRAYEFRERCINAHAYFSSAEYKTHIGQTHDRKDRCSKNKTTEADPTLVKVELMPYAQDAICERGDLEMGPEKKPKDELETADAEREFIALNEDVIMHDIYDDAEVNLVDQSMEYTAHKLLQCDKMKGKIEIESKDPIDEKNRAAIVKPKKVGKAFIYEPGGDDTTAIHLKIESKGERKNKAKTYICDQCGNHFKYRSHFYSHITRHTGVKPLQCEVCPNKFFTEGELKRHMRRHTGERPFPCQHCERRFTDYSTRIKHERTHTNERPFVCPQCGKAFTTSYVLKNHMLVHTGERSFKCTLCNKSFQRQTHLIVHTRSLSHKQNFEREQYKLTQKASEEMRSLSSQLSTMNT
ncbi:zinc finger protein 271-like [Anastrepha ludens]|uniref:zinc finger protein 271-like n=1 Tax=Anastrepha ludens TaxID=28586 RepID=UPI0023AF2012|nr:zinc finger protein 271-like [Anastrepha ludens]